MEHKQHRTDNMVRLYATRFAQKTKNDEKIQLSEQARIGKLRKELVDERFSDCLRVDEDGLPIYKIEPTKEEQKILDIIRDTKMQSYDAFNEKMEEMECQLDACDTYEQEMAILISYSILRPHDLHIETFKPEDVEIPEEK